MHLKLLETLGLVSDPEQFSQHFAIIGVRYEVAGREHKAQLTPDGTSITFTDNQVVILVLVVNPIGDNGFPTTVGHQLTGTLHYHEGVLQQAIWHLADGTQTKAKMFLADLD